MKRFKGKLLAVLLTVAVVSPPPVTTNAADWPLKYENKWLTQQMQGHSEYVVPYSGYYDVVLAGAQGSGYNNQNGGKGATIKATIWLNKDSVISYDVPLQPEAGHDVNGVQTIPGGQASKFYVDGDLVLLAAGGAGQYSDDRPSQTNAYPAIPETIPELIMQDGEGTQGQDWHDMKMHWHAFPSFYKYHYDVAIDQSAYNLYIDTRPGHYPAYLDGTHYGHWHDQTMWGLPMSPQYCMIDDVLPDIYPLTYYNTACFTYSHGRVRVYCDDAYLPIEWNSMYVGPHHGVSDWVTIDSNGRFNYPCGATGILDLWFDKRCGKMGGDITSGEWSSNGECGWETTDENQLEITSQSYDNVGPGKFQIGIHQRTLNYLNKVVNYPLYYEKPVYLIIYDDTIAYFKRP